MHALVNSYGVWKKTFLSFGCRISLLKYFPTLSPVWDLVLVFIEHSPQGSLSQLLLKISTFIRTKQDESQPLLGPPCKAWSLLEIIAHKRAGLQEGNALLHPQPSQLVFNSHTTCVFRLGAQSLPQRVTSFLFWNEWLHRPVGWAQTFLRRESKYFTLFVKTENNALGFIKLGSAASKTLAALYHDPGRITPS